MKSGMKIAVIGYGSIGKRHAANLKSLGQTVVIHDPPAGHKISGSELNSASAWVICSPPATHYPYLQRAIEMGMPVFVEKPLCTVRQLTAAKTLLVGAKTLVYPGYCLRHLSQLQELRTKLVTMRVYGFRMDFGYDIRLWRPETDYRNGYNYTDGLLLDATHEFDMLRYLLCGEVSTATGVMQQTGAVPLEMQAWDSIDMVLRVATPSRVIAGTVHSDMVQKTYYRHYRFWGDAGVMEWQVDINSDSLRTMYINEMRDFLHCVTEHSKSAVVDIQDAVAAMTVALLCSRGARGSR